MKKSILLISSIFALSITCNTGFSLLSREQPRSTLSFMLNGTVQSGAVNHVPISGAQVAVYKAGDVASNLLGTATTDNLGAFHLELPALTSPNTFYYAIASKESTLKLAVVLGNSLPKNFVINELTTVAAAYSMSRFFHSDDQIYGGAQNLHAAAGMNANLVDSGAGVLSPIITSPPNADQTNSMRSINSLSNLITTCVQNRPNACDQLFRVTTVNNNAPSNTLYALLNIVHNPANHVSDIFKLSRKSVAYQPALKKAPDAWTLALKFNNTGSSKYLFGGPGNLKFDSRGYAWITNNVIQGTPNSANFLVVLKPNGQPADGKVSGIPRSPVFGGGILGQGFGIAIDNRKGVVWSGNFGWGHCARCVPKKGSVTETLLTGRSVSPSTGFISFVHRAQGMNLDSQGNLWITSNDNDRVVVFLGADPNKAIYFQERENSGPFDVVIDSQNNAWVSNSKSAILSKYTLDQGVIKPILSVQVGKSIKKIVPDSQDNIWVASTGDSSVYQVTPDGSSIKRYTGVGGLSGPWGVSVDGNQNILVANFGTTDVPKVLSLTKLCGINTSTCPPGLKTGDAISPNSGYTLPSGGSEVLLYNGQPLNGAGSKPVFKPLMRLTDARVDQAGNVWALNNWKPVPFNTVTDFNPGGDGVIVFVGLAEPVNVSEI